jgi:hypothetical protein
MPSPTFAYSSPGADAGPIPDSLKQTEPPDYGALSAADLAKLINDEYGLILSSERTNLNRAKAIGQKLTWLRARATHGEWQKKLEVWCPKLSYEIAVRYIRIHEKWTEIGKAAAAKNAVTADLTIDAALKLLAKPPKQKKADSAKADDQTNDKGDADTGDSSDGEDDEDDADDDEGDDGFMPEVHLKAFSPADLVALLQRIHDTEYLTALAAELMKVLRSTPSATATASEVSVRRM